MTAATSEQVAAAVSDLELSEPLPAIRGRDPEGRRVQRAWLLLRLYTEPVGALLLDLPEPGLSPDVLTGAIAQAHGPAIHRRLIAAAATAGPPPYLARRAEVLTAAPPITVVVCTREHPESLARCLAHLQAQQYPRFRVLVVDNAPRSGATAEVVARAATRGPVEYVVEPRPGLSHARNRALASAPGQILAWIDDDELADPYWLAELARALADHPSADAVTGAIIPAELRTEAQLWFEWYGGHSKGRGFESAVFSPATAHRQSPLYPLPPFGAGGNMAFRPGALERIGGFDPALGAGTPAMGSEDTLVFSQLLLAGGTVVYQPSALVRHHHRPDLAGLRSQLTGYGRGLTAAYTSLLLADPRLVAPMLRLVPTALRDLFGRGGRRLSDVPADFPRELLREHRRAMLAGPRAYLRGRREVRAEQAGAGRGRS